MFAPKGYISFHEFFEIAREISRSLVWAFRAEGHAGDFRIEQVPGEREAVECWLACQFASNQDLYICSPTGVVLRAPSLLFRHLDQIEMLPCPIPIEDSSIKMPERPDLFELSDHQYFWSRFPLFSFTTGQVKKQIEATEALSDISGFSQSTQDVLLSNMRKISEGLSAYGGWSICFDQEVFERNESELLNDFGVISRLLEEVNDGSPCPLKPFDERPFNRKRKRDRALDSYEACYPSGHEAAGDSLKVATNRVSDALGELVSEDTLRRALGKKK